MKNTLEKQQIGRVLAALKPEGTVSTDPEVEQTISTSTIPFITVADGFISSIIAPASRKAISLGHG